MLNFPYHKDARGDYFPIVDFLIYGKDKVQRTSELVDSGAREAFFIRIALKASAKKTESKLRERNCLNKMLCERKKDTNQKRNYVWSVFI